MDKNISIVEQAVTVFASRSASDTQEASSPDVVSIVHWEKGARIRRAGMLFGLLWGLIIPAIFIPILHFILVPLLFVAAPIAAFCRYRQESQINEKVFVCPACKAENKLSATSVQWPLHIRCSGCGRFLRIEKVDANVRN